MSFRSTVPGESPSGSQRVPVLPLSYAEMALIMAFPGALFAYFPMKGAPLDPQRRKQQRFLSTWAALYGAVAFGYYFLRP